MHTIGKSIAIFIWTQGQGIEQTQLQRCLDRQVRAPLRRPLRVPGPKGLRRDPKRQTALLLETSCSAPDRHVSQHRRRGALTDTTKEAILALTGSL